MAVAIANTYQGTKTTANPSATYSITVASGEQLYVWVYSDYEWGTAKSVSGVTFNGDALANVASIAHPDQARARLELWRILAPDAATGDLVVTLSATTDVDHWVAVICRMVTGADSTNPVTASSTNTSNASFTIGDTVSSAAGELVIDGGAYRNNSVYMSATGGDQSDVSILGAESGRALFSSSKAGAASVSTEWTSSDVSAYWGLIALASIAPAAAATPVPPPIGGSYRVVNQSSVASAMTHHSRRFG